jgi:DNA polymerase III sliding clamp (beta) subunit (PCNA family)
MSDLPRDELLSKLETAAAALAETNETVMGRYWFDGEYLTAFNDQIAVRVPLACDFAGAVARHITSTLALSKASTAKLRAGNGVLTLRVGGGTFELPMLPPGSFAGLFSMPDSERADLDHQQRRELLSALRCCALSISDDIARPEYLGVTVLQDGEHISLYATDGKTMSHARIPRDGWPPIDRRVLLPSLFCQQAVKLLERAEAVAIGVHPDHVLMVADDVYLFGRLISNARPLDFPGIFAQHFPPARMRDLIAAPKLLPAIMRRATLYAKGEFGQPRSRFTVRERLLQVHSNTAAKGKAVDKVRDFAQPDVTLTTNPQLVLAALDRFDKMLLTGQCVIFANAADQYHLVAGTEERQGA